MSKADVEREILLRMQGIFLPPKDYKTEDQVKAALGEYASALERFQKPDLEAAWQVVRDGHTSRGWPMPGAFVAAANRARMDREHVAGPAVKEREKASQAIVWAYWLQVRKSDKALEAARLGVAWAFKCAVMDGQKIGQIDLGRLVRGKVQANATHRRISEDLNLFDSRGRDIGVMRGRHKDLALNTFHGLLVKEAETSAEIGFTGVVETPEELFEALA